MRTFIFVVAALLTGCGSDSDVPDIDKSPDLSAYALKSSLPPNEATSVQALRAQVASLQESLKQIQLVGKIRSAGTDAFGNLLTRAVAQAVDFGLCANMGVLQGRGGSDTANPQLSQFELYKNCVGVYASYNDITGFHDKPPFAAWDKPGCDGNLYIFSGVSGESFSDTLIAGGVVFASPLPGDNAVYWAQGASFQSPQDVDIQSEINTSPAGGVCEPVFATVKAVRAIHNDSSLSGVPDSLPPGSWSTFAP